MENFTNADYMHAKWVCKNFEIKIEGVYQDFFLKSDTLLLADVFIKMYLSIYHIDPTKFLSVPGLAWQETLKKNRGKIRIINKYWYAING